MKMHKHDLLIEHKLYIVSLTVLLKLKVNNSWKEEKIHKTPAILMGSIPVF